MQHATRILLSIGALAVSAFAYHDPKPEAPQADSLDPRVGKAGTILRVKGRGLSKASVDEVYLTDHRFDLKVKVLEQTDTGLTIRVPPFVKPGRLQLLFLTAGKNPLFLEQPFFVQIEDGEESATPAAAPVEVTNNSSKPPKTVEVASANTSSIPVPAAPALPPMTSAPAPRAAETSAAPVQKSKDSPQQQQSKNNSKEKVDKKRSQAAPSATVAGKQAQTPESTEPANNGNNNAPKTEPVVEMAKNITPPATVVPSQPQPQVQQPPAPAPAPATTPVAGQPEVPAASVPQQPQPTNTVVPAQVLKRSRVTYPTGASAARIEGDVELLATVRVDGRVKDVKVIKGNPYLVPAAANAVREWLYEPAKLNGHPVESEVSVVLHFKRPGN